MSKKKKAKPAWAKDKGYKVAKAQNERKINKRERRQARHEDYII